MFSIFRGAASGFDRPRYVGLSALHGMATVDKAVSVVEVSNVALLNSYSHDTEDCSLPEVESGGKISSFRIKVYVLSSV